MPQTAKHFLPHIDALGYYQFVTFRTYDSLDDFVFGIRQKEISDKQKEYAIDQYADHSGKGAYLNGEIMTFLKEYLVSKDKVLYDLIAFCIMPNHVHIVFKQNQDLPTVMQRIKGATAYHINKMLQRKGTFWEENYYDKVIRDDKHFDTVYTYVKNNPLKAGLKDFEERFYSVHEK